ncbi:MAG: hypothetical protein QNJ46_34220 [Leptolyngbyaceae cyanobacterium MO_188.B28]|nr:hypothetical protein [Leptolyngbyaceae cyanobacterium MO_188.B28]
MDFSYSPISSDIHDQLLAYGTPSSRDNDDRLASVEDWFDDVYTKAGAE